jgi:hypothetical protein
LASNHQDEQRLALFIDFENIAIGVRDAHYRKFDINLVLERLLEKGKVLVKKAYADWSRYSDYKRAFHEAAIELIEVPRSPSAARTRPTSAWSWTRWTCRSRRSTSTASWSLGRLRLLAPRLQAQGEQQVRDRLGVKNSTSDLLIENCDEFIFYEDLVRGQQRQIPS